MHFATLSYSIPDLLFTIFYYYCSSVYGINRPGEVKFYCNYGELSWWVLNIFWGSRKYRAKFLKRRELGEIEFWETNYDKFFGEQSRNFKLFQRIKEHGPLGSPRSKINSMDAMKAITIYFLITQLTILNYFEQFHMNCTEWAIFLDRQWKQ